MSPKPCQSGRLVAIARACMEAPPDVWGRKQGLVKYPQEEGLAAASGC